MMPGLGQGLIDLLGVKVNDDDGHGQDDERGG
jgi:hypothetical protein